MKPDIRSTSPEPMMNNPAGIAKNSLALLQLAADLGGEVTDVVEGMHSNIGRMPMPLAKLKAAKTRGITGLVYRAVHGSFEAVANGLNAASNAIPTTDIEDEGWIKFCSALNGVCGDRLTERNNPLAIDMSLQNQRGSGNELLLFVHGLCMSELGWRGDGYEQLVQHWNGRTASLRYNSGQHISENGEALAALLETLTKEQSIERLAIVGHSMGGLLSRSALAFAETNSHQWPKKLSHLVLLGSPHNGAPLERAGNLANSLLTLSPYSAALAGLGNLRSNGIRDLRHSNLKPSDWQSMESIFDRNDYRSPTPLPKGPEVLLLAGTRSDTLPAKVSKAKDDLLVPVASGLGLHSRTEFQLKSPKLQRKLLAATDHMELLWSHHVYTTITRWIDGEDIEPLTEVQLAR